MDIKVIFKNELDNNIFDKEFYLKLLESIREVKKTKNENKKSFLSEA